MTGMHIRLYRHDTAGDFIDIDDRTGAWCAAPQDPDNPPLIGAMPVTMRVGQEIRGSYTTENERRCCLYWNDERELVFRTHYGRRLCLFRYEADGTLTDLAPDLQVQLEPATYGDGREMQGMSVFSLHDPVQGTLYEITYDSLSYVRMFGIASMLTFIPDEELGDFDFFVGAKRAVEELRNTTGRTAMAG